MWSHKMAGWGPALFALERVKHLEPRKTWAGVLSAASNRPGAGPPLNHGRAGSSCGGCWPSLGSRPAWRLWPDASGSSRAFGQRPLVAVILRQGVLFLLTSAPTKLVHGGLRSITTGTARAGVRLQLYLGHGVVAEPSTWDVTGHLHGAAQARVVTAVSGGARFRWHLSSARCGFPVAGQTASMARSAGFAGRLGDHPVGQGLPW